MCARGDEIFIANFLESAAAKECLDIAYDKS